MLPSVPLCDRRLRRMQFWAHSRAPAKAGASVETRKVLRFWIPVGVKVYIIAIAFYQPRRVFSLSVSEQGGSRPFRRSDGPEASSGCGDRAGATAGSAESPDRVNKTGKAKRARSSFSFTASLARRCATFYFFLWRFLRRRFFRLWVAILCRLCFFPFGIVLMNLVNWIQ